ncbi:biorientation of chromosomes in cell division protein 1-like 1 isoform X1 [Suncus etruscus]|uniref:biorientation of chromosomes in cell division protein 1-like 1 isoform X1 n=1 Tax=Suncus etruscus TaxID=109475 RepID=UPI00210F386C|nr:biorientation of chromosomes in cell division protein 1-like 1 isoform X1 [Suncus etruscus]
MSILETITSLNQEASAARASTEISNAKSSERVSRRLSSQPSTESNVDRERGSEDAADREKAPTEPVGEGQEVTPKSEESSDPPCLAEESKGHARESNLSAPLPKDTQQESSEPKGKMADKGEKKPEASEKERKKEKKEKTEKKLEHSKRNEDGQKVKDEKQAKEKEAEVPKLPSEKNSNKSKSTDGSKEDGSLIDSDMDGLTDITVSSVHTSDLSSFEEDTEEEVVMSESMEEGEITSDDEEKSKKTKTQTQSSNPSEGKAKSVRHAYVHKPYLYSKYYSDSDDELTVEQRRQSIAKEKEERLLRRQINREKLEEKRKQKAEKTKSSKVKSQGKSNVDLEDSSSKNLEPKAPGIKEVLKERKVLEKKVALSKKRKKDSRNVEDISKKKQQSEEDVKETIKTTEHCEKEKVSSSKDLKHVHAKPDPNKPARRLSESLHSADENKNEREHKRRTSTPVLVETAQEETDTREGKRQAESSETGPEETQKPKSTFKKDEKHLKKDDSETLHLKSLPKKEAKSSSKEKSEKEKTLSEDKPFMKHKYKGDSLNKAGDEAEPHSSEKGLKAEESLQKQSQQTKLSSDDKAERKSKHRNERKLSVLGKDGKPVSEYIIKAEENARKENKKERHTSTDKTKTEHKSRRLSDSKIQKDSQSFRQHGITGQRRSESYSEDKCDTDSNTLDSNLKPEEVVHKERRRTKSLVEEKPGLKSKSKSQGKLVKVVETESHESVSKQSTTAKPDKEKNTEESDPDRQRKSKVEDKLEEAGVEPALESPASSSHSTQKDSGHRAKLPLAKEKHKGEKDSSSSRPERKLSAGHKSRSLKHSSKDLRKKEENKSDDKDGKEADGNHEKARGSSAVTEKKVSRKLSENRRGSLSQEIPKGEEKLTGNTLGTSHLQKPKKSGETTLTPEQEPMETDSEPATENVCEVSKTQDSSNNASNQDIDSESVTKLKTAATTVKEEVKTSTVDAKTVTPASKSRHGSGLASNAEKHADHKSSQTKKVQSNASKLNPGEKEVTQPGAHEMNADLPTGARTFPQLPAGNSRAQKNLKNAVKPTEDCAAPRETALEHSTNVDRSPHFSSVTLAHQTQAHDADAVSSNNKRTVSEGTRASISRMNSSEISNRSLAGKQSEASRASDSKESGAVPTEETRAKAGTDSKRHNAEGCQATSLLSKQGKVNTALDSKSTASIPGNENVDKDGNLMDRAEKTRGLSSGLSSKQTVRAAVENGRKDGGAMDHVVGMSAERDTETIEHKDSRDPCEVDKTPSKMERNSEVDTSAGNDTTSSVSPQRNGEAKNISPGCGEPEKSPIATSTERTAKDVILNPASGGGDAATTTSSEKGKGKVAIPCTSIEADEGMIAGRCSIPPLGGAEASGGGTVFAAAEEGGGFVTEGFAESETFLTSTKEGESGECPTAGSGDRVEDPVTAHTVREEDSVNSINIVTEEKDDAVTSAGSEGKCDAGSSGRDSERVRGAAAFISEVESDGAVTSAGTEIRAGSMSSEEMDGFQRTVTRLGPKKETEGAVTCTGAERRGDDFVMCSVTGAGPPEELMVTGAAVVLVDDNVPPGTGAPQEQDGPVNDGTEGESAVTSTGITEEDGEGPASCTGLEENSEGFALSSESEENGENAMDSTAAKEGSNAPLVAASLCDDEGIVTSTGAKEEDDEGEGLVTSTGRGNEVGHSSTCTGLEEGEGAMVCESAEEGPGQIGTAAGHVEAEAGAAVAHANESNVDSMGGVEKEMKDPEICSSAKGIVESSVTSEVLGKAEVTGAAVGSEGPGTSTTLKERDSLLSRREKLEDGAISTGLVGGSYEVLVSGAAPACEVDGTLPSGKEAEGVITSVENEECGGLLATTAHDNDSDQTNSAGAKTEGKGLIISTSATNSYTIPSSKTVDVAEGHSRALRTEQDRESSRGSMEEFEAPMPSAASRVDNQTVALQSEEKDECAMISTSIREEFDVPISSATTTKCAESQQPGATAEAQVEGLALRSTDDFEVPMPSASTAPRSPLASTSKEEKDECALISTSIAEECEASILGENRCSAVIVEEKDGSAIISTSSVEDCEGPVSSAAPQEDIQPSVTLTEEISDATMISTSTSEGCEAVMMEAAPQDEAQPASVQRVEDLGDAAIISTSTAESAECGGVTASSLDRHEDGLPAAASQEGRDKDGPAVAKVSRGEVPMPSQMNENSCQQHPGPFTEEVGSVGATDPTEGQDKELANVPSAGDQPGTKEERQVGELQNASFSHQSPKEQTTSLSPVQREQNPSGPGMKRDSPLRGSENSANSSVGPRGKEQTSRPVPGDSSIGVGCAAAVNFGATEAGDLPHISDATSERSSLPPDQQGSRGSVQTPAECINGQDSTTTPCHTLVPPAANDAVPSAATGEQDLTGKSESGDGVTKLPQEEGDPKITIYSEASLGDPDNEESPSNVLGSSEQKPELKSETCIPPEKEKSHETPAHCERTSSGAADLRSEPPLAQEPLNDEEEEKLMPKRKRKKLCPSSDDELDDNLDILDSKRETQKPLSEIEPQDSKEENARELDELSTISAKTSSAAASAAADEKDESSSSEAAGEKTDQNEEDSGKSQEEGQPVIIKRKRGRPRKYPVESALKTKEDSKTDTGLITVSNPKGQEFFK